MDDIKAQAVEWCERARRLVATPIDSRPETLASRLDFIGTGLLLRRGLDSSGQSDDVENTRRELLRELAELQQGALAQMTSLAPGSERHELVARRSREWLAEIKSAVRSITGAVGPDPLHKALAIEGLRNELEWQSAVIDRVDRETPDPATAWVDVELARLSASLRVAAPRQTEASDLPLQEGCERLQGILLSRRIGRELAWPIAGSAPEALWGHRFQLTRLRAQAMATNLASGQDAFHARLALERADWIDALDRRRFELARAARDRMVSLAVCDRVAAGERIVQLALDEAGETMAFLEDMSIDRAVDRLKLIGDDLAQLSESCLEWPRVEQTRQAARDFPDEIFLPTPGPIPGAASNHSIGEEFAQEVTEQERVEASRSEAEEQDERARKRLRRRRGPCAAQAARWSATGRKNCWRCGWRIYSGGGSSRFSRTRCWCSSWCCSD